MIHTSNPLINPLTNPLWHPCTQMYAHQTMPPINITRANGAYLYTATGQPIIDAISSWWVNLHGHCHPKINQAVIDQLGQLEQVMLAGFSHPSITTLAQRLVDLTPTPLKHCFFADSGSAAIEVALKMSLQYWHQHGEPQRNTFISLKQGYHGETLGSLSVTDIPLFSSQYQPLLIQHLRAPSPDLTLKQADESETEFLQRTFNAMRLLVEQQLIKNKQTVCAIIVEPLVQGAAGMKMYPPVYLQWLRQLCSEHHIHLILDEIAVGFGRTGSLFALEHANICPDFLCLSKGLTAGYLPMSCVLTTHDVYRTFYSPNVAQGFLHSHSFTGNPLAARCALASLDIFSTENTLQNNQILINAIAKKLAELQFHPHIMNIRQTGMIAAFEVVAKDKTAILGQWIGSYAVKQGVLLRPIGNQVYMIPPYCITLDDINRMFDVTLQALEWAVMQTQPSGISDLSPLP